MDIERSSENPSFKAASAAVMGKNTVRFEGLKQATRTSMIMSNVLKDDYEDNKIGTPLNISE